MRKELTIRRFLRREKIHVQSPYRSTHKPRARRVGMQHHRFQPCLTLFVARASVSQSLYPISELEFP